MADWTGSSGNTIRPYRNLTAPLIRQYEESTAAATAVIRRGDVLTFDTVVATAGHRVVRAPSSAGTGTNLMEVDITSLIGIALEDSTSDGSTSGLTGAGTARMGARRISVCFATQDQEFLGYASSMVPASSAANQVSVGLSRPLVYDRTLHRFFIGISNATAALAAVQITEIPEYALGDSGVYPVIFKFLSTNLSPVVPGSNS